MLQPGEALLWSTSRHRRPVLGRFFFDGIPHLAGLARLTLFLLAALCWATFPARAQADLSTLLSATLNEHNSVMLLIEPESGAIIDANDAAGRFYGYGVARLRTMHIQDINTLGPDEVERERFRAKAEKRNYFIFPHRLADGQLRTVEVYSAPLQDASGTKSRTLLLSIIHDITGKTVAEDELTTYRQHLEELVSRRTQEALEAQNRLRLWMALALALQTVLIVALIIAVIRRHAAVREVAYEAHTRHRAEERLAIANAELQRFAEIAAHHLQEPTRRLMVFAQRLGKLLPPQPDENVAFSLTTIEEQAAYLHALVRDVQVYLAASSPLGPQSVNDPAALINQIAAELAARSTNPPAELICQALPPVFMDTPRLRYLLTALLDNCLRHARPGQAVRIQVSGIRQNDRVTLSISDNGPGIPLEYRQRVLEVFEHLTPASTDGQPGTGLGLAVARRIVESCDGQVHITDSPLGGVSIVMDLPGDEE